MTDAVHGRRPRRRQACRPDLARHRRRRAAGDARQEGRPYRHARSARIGRAAAGARHGDAAGAVSLQRATRSTRPIIALGVSTDTYDRAGDGVDRAYARSGGRSDARGDRAMRWRSSAARFLQQPPVVSRRRRSTGDRAYDLRAPRMRRLRLAPVERSRAHRSKSLTGARRPAPGSLVCSAGFYVRSLAHDLGERLGTGAHLAALRPDAQRRFRAGGGGRRSRSSTGGRDEAAARVIPLAEPAAGAAGGHPDHRRARRWRLAGGFLGPGHLKGPAARAARPGEVRLLHPDGHLVAIARARPARRSGLLHPGVVLV